MLSLEVQAQRNKIFSWKYSVFLMDCSENMYFSWKAYLVRKFEKQWAQTQRRSKMQWEFSEKTQNITVWERLENVQWPRILPFFSPPPFIFQREKDLINLPKCISLWSLLIEISDWNFFLGLHRYICTPEIKNNKNNHTLGERNLLRKIKGRFNQQNYCPQRCFPASFVAIPWKFGVKIETGVKTGI